MRKRLFVTIDELEEIERCYEVEFNGLSGSYEGFNWFTAKSDKETLELYIEAEQD